MYSSPHWDINTAYIDSYGSPYSGDPFIDDSKYVFLVKYSGELDGGYDWGKVDTSSTHSYGPLRILISMKQIHANSSGSIKLGYINYDWDH